MLLELLGAADEAAEPERLGPVQGFFEQEGLADAGLTFEQDHPALACRSLGEEQKEFAELGTPGQ